MSSIVIGKALIAVGDRVSDSKWPWLVVGGIALGVAGEIITQYRSKPLPSTFFPAQKLRNNLLFREQAQNAKRSAEPAQLEADLQPASPGNIERKTKEHEAWIQEHEAIYKPWEESFAEYVLRRTQTAIMNEANTTQPSLDERMGLRETWDKVMRLWRKPEEINEDVATPDVGTSHSPAKEWQRFWPLPNPNVDSAFIKQKPNGEISFRYVHDHPGSKFFSDSEILQVYLDPSGFSGTLGTRFSDQSEVEIGYGIDPFGHHVLQQQGLRACTAAVVAMISMDHGKSVNMFNLLNTEIGNTASMALTLTYAGLSLIVIKPDMPLEQAIATYGSLIISMDSEIGGHAIIVDAFDPTSNTAHIRDPYHGWSIETTATALLTRRIYEYRAIQPKRI